MLLEGDISTGAALNAATILMVVAILIYVNWARQKVRNARETVGEVIVLIDGENMPSWSYEAVIELLVNQTSPIKRIYADWAVPATQSWRDTIKRHSLEAVSVIAAIPGKNATDIHLTIDAVHLGATREPTTFIVVSSDTDFIPLYKKLRSLGHQVIVVGLAQTPVAVQNAVDEFICVVSPRDRDREMRKAQTGAPLVDEAHDESTPHELAVAAWRSVADDDGWAYLQDVGRVLTQRNHFERVTRGRSLSATIKDMDCFSRRVVENRMQIRCMSER